MALARQLLPARQAALAVSARIFGIFGGLQRHPGEVYNGKEASSAARDSQVKRGAIGDDGEEQQMADSTRVTEMIHQIASAAREDPSLAAAVREAILESGLFDVFGSGETLDVVDILDAGGEDALRARLSPLSLAELRGIVRANKYDPERESARWRSAARFIGLIVERAKMQLEQEQKTGAATKSLAEASWML
ncbi:MAG TPA: hypothetical protein VF812_08725 [Ktedonobacterales bacterium]